MVALLHGPEELTMLNDPAFYRGLFVDPAGDVWRRLAERTPATEKFPFGEEMFLLTEVQGCAAASARAQTRGEIREYAGELHLFGTRDCPAIGGQPSEGSGTLALGLAVIVLVCLIVAVAAIALARMIGALP